MRARPPLNPGVFSDFAVSLNTDDVPSLFMELTRLYSAAWQLPTCERVVCIGSRLRTYSRIALQSFCAG